MNLGAPVRHVLVNYFDVEPDGPFSAERRRAVTRAFGHLTGTLKESQGDADWMVRLDASSSDW
ncbi:MAG: hypothetical protein NVS1B12_15320 [Acidimicrobiales bacterium]